MKAATAAATAPAVPAVPHPSRPVGPGRPQPGHVARGPLRLVPPLRTGAPRAPFVVLLGTLLTGGLAGLLFLHTALAEDSFRLHDLKTRSAQLTDREQALEQQVALEASPRRLSARAEALGMVHSQNPVFIRLTDGKVLGHPKAGVAPAPVVASAAPSSSASPGPSASGKPSSGKPSSGRAGSGRAASSARPSSGPGR